MVASGGAEKSPPGKCSQPPMNVADAATCEDWQNQSPYRAACAPVTTTMAATVAAKGSATGATGLEPATSGVTGRRSNQLSYAPWRSGASMARKSRP
jgi:hypothetical protein